MLEGLRIKNKKLLLSFILVNLIVAVVGVMKWESLYVPVMRLNFLGFQGLLMANVVFILGVLGYPTMTYTDLAESVRLIMWQMLTVVALSLTTIVYMLIFGKLPNPILVGIELVLLFNMFGYFIYDSISYLIRDGLKEILNSITKK